MHRHQADGLGDKISRQNTIDASSPEVVRAEFGPESDVKNILKRYGVLPQQQRQPFYTETDFDTDLQTAIIKIERVNDAFNKLPKKHREKYPTVDDLWYAYQTGTITDEPEKPASAPTPAVSGPLDNQNATA